MLTRKSGSDCSVTIMIIIFCSIFLASYLPLTDCDDTSEFPIGLRLEYNRVQEIGFNTIQLGSTSYTVLNWIVPDTEVSIKMADSEGEVLLSVSLPSWHAVDENGSDQGYLKPLWMDISAWKKGDNVTLGAKGLFNLNDMRSIETASGTYQCWTARQESRGDVLSTYEHYYYNLQHGVLVEHWYSRWYFPTNGIPSVSEITTELVSTNLDDYNPVYSIFLTPLNILIICGIFVEIIIVLYLMRKF